MSLHIKSKAPPAAGPVDGFLEPSGPFSRWPKGRRATPEERAYWRDRAKRERKLAGASYWPNRAAKEKQKLDGYRERIARAEALIAAEKEPARLALLRQDLEHLTALSVRTTRAYNRAKTKADLDRNTFRSSARFTRENQSAISAARNWPRQRKEAEKADRKARRDGVDRAGFEGRRQTGKRAESDPWSGKRENLTANVGHDVLEFLRAHRHISEKEKIAGDVFRQLVEAAGFTGVGAIDYERVVGSHGPKTPVSDEMLWARDRLVAIRNHLGFRGYQLLMRVIVEGMSIAEMARMGSDIREAESVNGKAR